MIASSMIAPTRCRNCGRCGLCRYIAFLDGTLSDVDIRLPRNIAGEPEE